MQEEADALLQMGMSVPDLPVLESTIFKKYIGPNVRMKASSGMVKLEEGAVFVEMGCERLGSKLLVNIAKEQGVV